MKKSLIISEADNIAALMENDRVVEFFVNRGELLLGDIYVAIVENILPGIDAAFVNLGKDKMGFLHANDIPGDGTLKERLVPKQKLLVQITKEPTGHKGPRVSTAVSLPGRFLVLVPEERGISISRRISESKERARLKSVVTLMKPPGVGVIIRTEAKGQNEASLFEDFEALWDRWQTIVSEGEASIGPKLVYRDQDLLYRVIRDAYTTDVSEIIVDTADGQKRAQEFMSGWAGRTTKVLPHTGDEPLLVTKNIDKDIESVLSDRAELPSGGHLNIQPTEALTVIDVNSGRFTSSRTQAETVRRTNLEAAQEIPRQLRLRNIGGMVIVDFIDMESRRDQQQVLEVFNRSLEDDRAKPQVGQMSDLGLVELTRRRQGQSLRELFAIGCTHCSGTGVVPTLVLGSGENKRVIAHLSKEDEMSKSRSSSSSSRRGQSGRSGGQPLRAASAGAGRVQHTVQEFEPEEEAEGLEELPEDILEQMPEELLDEVAATGRKFAHGELDEEDTEDAVPASSYSSSSSSSYSRQTVMDFADDLILDVEAEESEPETVPVETVFDEPTFVEPEEEIAPEVDAAVEVVSETVEVTPIPEPLPEPESDYDTEVDPVTGIYRLKVKTKVEGEDSASGNGLHAESEHYGNPQHGYEMPSAQPVYAASYTYEQSSAPVPSPWAGESTANEPSFSNPSPAPLHHEIDADVASSLEQPADADRTAAEQLHLFPEVAVAAPSTPDEEDAVIAAAAAAGSPSPEYQEEEQQLELPLETSNAGQDD
ncbi:MAG: Rne/Rng family ribonuclease [Candidatus Obscuribacterales bacterium]|nr:Rne/Rng family ribonuclease [Candidatus Obscuribacterales bacterium]